jgi:hypothetical protein
MIISFLHVSGNCVPIIRRKYRTYVTPGIVTLYGWLSLFYMFRATMCPSSGENTVPMWHLVLSLYMDDYLVCRVECPAYHRYGIFSWWWAPSWLFSQEYTRTHGQRNMKFWIKTQLQYSVPVNQPLKELWPTLNRHKSKHGLRSNTEVYGCKRSRPTEKIATLWPSGRKLYYFWFLFLGMCSGTSGHAFIYSGSPS